MASAPPFARHVKEIFLFIHSFIHPSSHPGALGDKQGGDHVTEGLVGQGQGVYSVLSLGAHSWVFLLSGLLRALSQDRGASLCFRALLSDKARSPGSRGRHARARVRSGQGTEAKAVPRGEETDWVQAKGRLV